MHNLYRGTNRRQGESNYSMRFLGVCYSRPEMMQCIGALVRVKMLKFENVNSHVDRYLMVYTVIEMNMYADLDN